MSVFYPKDVSSKESPLCKVTFVQDNPYESTYFRVFYGDGKESNEVYYEDPGNGVRAEHTLEIPNGIICVRFSYKGSAFGSGNIEQILYYTPGPFEDPTLAVYYVYGDCTIEG